MRGCFTCFSSQTACCCAIEEKYLMGRNCQSFKRSKESSEYDNAGIECLFRRHVRGNVHATNFSGIQHRVRARTEGHYDLEPWLCQSSPVQNKPEFRDCIVYSSYWVKFNLAGPKGSKTDLIIILVITSKHGGQKKKKIYIARNVPGSKTDDC